MQSEIDKPKAKVKLLLSIEVEIDSYTEENNAKFYYEENFCVENIIQDLASKVKENECNLCSKSKIKLLEYKKQ